MVQMRWALTPMRVATRGIANMKQIILDYFAFEVYYQDGKYFFRDKDEEGQAVEVKPIATLEYTVDRQPDDDSIEWLFPDCMCCGEYVHDNGITYIWFDVVEGE